MVTRDHLVYDVVEALLENMMGSNNPMGMVTAETDSVDITICIGIGKGSSDLLAETYRDHIEE